MKLNHFKDINFLAAIKALFNELKVPMNYVADEPTTAKEILKDTYKKNETFLLVNDVYFVGMIDDAAFEGNQSLNTQQIKSDYDGILVFGITLNARPNNLLPTRSQLAEISRAFNREFYYTPVVLVFKYQNDAANYIAFANTERLKYKQAWREGEKAGKVSLLRDINIEKPHRGHEDIINQLRIPTSGKKAVDSYSKLYIYWQEVFNVSVLNKRFYQELSNWYFWAIKHVTFPNKPTAETVIKKYGKFGQQKLDELIQEHNATNVIRLLTRLLFTWFIKEKKLIPEELFDLDSLHGKILNKISPDRVGGLFEEANLDSIYYKAILQNLFFASLNCPIEADRVDNRTRGFRGDGYGTHRGIDYLMRYKKYFKDPEVFLDIMNKTVPFLNGGLFECLDDKYQNLYIDGFSDQMTKGEQLIVPDYLFFGTAEEVDLSAEYGIKNKGTKQAAVKGLINILKSYKFTITENTPIEEDVALDPELLGKVFENLLASYNPETKTTARKQTGSFYTPREIVNYMVDESLIAYLKNAVCDWGMEEKELDEKLHQLTSFDPVNPFYGQDDLSKRIVKALDECTILDPACGSGAFPMGILQKMVHMLQKLDPQNEYWKEVQLNKAISATEEAFSIEDKKEREEKLIEINNAFDENINDPDYARKLYLIENCIYGVDIQPIATQIAKLRFFISLVVDQKATNHPKENFNIRPLPNLETKFVTANTLTTIEKENSLFYTDEIVNKENELKKVRHKLFSARTKDTKLKYRKKDKELREDIADILEKGGMPLEESKKLAEWDPYDQNTTSLFFDPEWMFDITEGFDIVIGNPPYIKEYTDRSAFDSIRGTKYYQGKMDIWYAFACTSIDYLNNNGLLCFIATNNWVTNTGASILRDKVLNETQMIKLLDFGSYMVFESAAIQTMILLTQKHKKQEYVLDHRKISGSQASLEDVKDLLRKNDNDKNSIRQFKFRKKIWEGKTLNFENAEIEKLLGEICSQANFKLDAKKEVAQGIVPPQDFLNKRNQQKLGANYRVGEGIFNLNGHELQHLNINDLERKLIKPFYTTSELERFYGDNKNSLWVIYTDSSFKSESAMKSYPNLKRHLDRFKAVITSDNKPYGLHRARNEYFFKGEKIISLRKCSKPTFTYTDFDCYVSQTYFVIKSNRINQKYLTGLLNSKLIEFWLRYKGKMQGDLFQVDKAPILDIPIYKPDNTDSVFAQIIVDCIIFNRSIEKSTLLFEQVLDAIVFNLYFPDHMKEQEIDVLAYVERDINQALKGQEFVSLSDSEKDKVIEQLLYTWSDPNNEVRNRMKLFAVRSPEILKPILES